MFFVIETQVNNGVGQAIVTTKDTRNEAESDYHRVLQYAAISEIEIHGAVLLTEEGAPLKYQSYKHDSTQEAEA